MESLASHDLRVLAADALRHAALRGNARPPRIREYLRKPFQPVQGCSKDFGIACNGHYRSLETAILMFVFVISASLVALLPFVYRASIGPGVFLAALSLLAALFVAWFGVFDPYLRAKAGWKAHGFALQKREPERAAIDAFLGRLQAEITRWKSAYDHTHDDGRKAWERLRLAWSQAGSLLTGRAPGNRKVRKVARAAFLGMAEDLALIDGRAKTLAAQRQKLFSVAHRLVARMLDHDAWPDAAGRETSLDDAHDAGSAVLEAFDDPAGWFDGRSVDALAERRPAQLAPRDLFAAVRHDVRMNALSSFRQPERGLKLVIGTMLGALVLGDRLIRGFTQ